MEHEQDQSLNQIRVRQFLIRGMKPDQVEADCCTRHYPGNNCLFGHM